MHPSVRSAAVVPDRPATRFWRSYAVPTAGTVFGAHQAFETLWHGGAPALAAGSFLLWTGFGFGLIMAARRFGLRTDAEIAGSPELRARVRARRPAMLLALAGAAGTALWYLL